MIIIGVSGKIGAGKDVVAERLCRCWGFQIVRWSDALKEEVLRIMPRTCAAIFNGTYDIDSTFEPDEDYLREMLWERKPPIVRALLQEWGTDLRRAEQHDYWTLKGHRAILALGEEARVVIPDTRFENEAQTILALDGEVWRIERPALPEGDGLPHASETSLDAWPGFSAKIVNAGTIEDLHALVDALMALRLPAESPPC